MEARNNKKARKQHKSKITYRELDGDELFPREPIWYIVLVSILFSMFLFGGVFLLIWGLLAHILIFDILGAFEFGFVVEHLNLSGLIWA